MHKITFSKSEADAHLAEATENADQAVLTLAEKLADVELIKELLTPIKVICKQKNLIIRGYYLACLTRMLFSCLIDADRTNSIVFEYPYQAHLLQPKRPNWQTAITKIEALYEQFAQTPETTSINQKRSEIADKCKQRATDAQGIYSLTVPTGGGKTLASLRYALHHAQRHQLDHIFFIIPYTSIIEQNAQVVRDVLENQTTVGEWVLEHHSNLSPEVDTWESKLIADNWNAPIIFTTMVQFLESWFSSGTRGARRLHQLANSVLIFDEIQTLPINCYYLFCNSINYLAEFCQTTSVLCTATQPVLNQLPDEQKGQLKLSNNSELMGETEHLQQLFDVLERVTVHDYCRHSGWELDEISKLAEARYQQTQSLLIIVNTKKWALDLYQSLSEFIPADSLFHLSTNQCPQHRKDLITLIKARLNKRLPVLCISTQLIEAGVDISFSSVIRFLAGLDSVAQAAGRCNRNGEMQDKAGNKHKGDVYIVNPASENLGPLETIKAGKKTTERVLWEKQQRNDTSSLLSPETLRDYFRYYSHNSDIQSAMDYPVTALNTSILQLLSDNQHNNYPENNRNRQEKGMFPKLYQSFMTANKTFKAIDAPTQAVVVPYGETGNAIIADLTGSETSDKAFYNAVKAAQSYSVNLYPHVWDMLAEQQAIYTVRDTGIYVLSDAYYHTDFGLSLEGTGKMDFLIT